MKIFYNVNKFDTIEQIAAKFNVDVQTLITCNNIVGEMPKVLTIPQSTNNFYVVANLQREFVLTMHDYKNNEIKLKTMHYICKKPEQLCLCEKQNNNIYVVSVLDTLQSICKKFNLNVNEIMQLNNMKSTNLFIGQMLKLQ